MTLSRSKPFGTLGFLLLVLSALTVGAVGCGLWAMQASALPQSKIDRLSTGMNKAEVKARLGNPSSIFTHSDGSMTWVYTRMTWSQFKIRFDRDGTVYDLEHDR